MVNAADLDAFAQSRGMGWTFSEIIELMKNDGDESPQYDENGVSVVESVIAPVPRLRAQEMRILEIIKNLGYEASAVPRQVPKKPWVKSETWNIAIKDRKTFSSRSVFDAAWERLRADKKIKEVSDI